MKSLLFLCYLVPTLLAIGIPFSSCRSYNKAGEQPENTQVWKDDFVISSREWPSGKPTLPLKVTSLDTTTVTFKDGEFVFATDDKPKVWGYEELECGKQKVILSDPDANYADKHTMVAVYGSCIVLDVIESATKEPDSPCLKFIEACRSKNRRVVRRSYSNKTPADWVIQKLAE